VDIHPIDAAIFGFYLLFMLGVGVYFMRKNQSDDDYYVGGRNMSAVHIGLSVVATDVGGGFSIGLGGLGFLMGLSGSWMLFTGLLGAWLSAVFLIPRVYEISRLNKLLTFPEALRHFYNPKVALAAAIISMIGYVGFTSSQILAGAKLASATFPSVPINTAVYIMGIIAVLYTAVGGIKAVIYTDTIQWSILMIVLLFIGIPLGYNAIGGRTAIVEVLDRSYLQLSNVSWVQLLNWSITIIPIWFVGMTLYQRIYACRDEKTAIRAWRLAGLFEWPIMAFMGIALGLFARVAFEQGVFAELGYPATAEIDAELGLPLFLRHILPIGLMGVMMSAYFSAILSTADSCLMAASGNFTTDIAPYFKSLRNKGVRTSQIVTGLVGITSVLLASHMQNVLELMLYSYAFMVSGLFVPVLAMIVHQDPSHRAALGAMVVGGTTTLVLILSGVSLPLDLDANIFGVSASMLTYLVLNRMDHRTQIPHHG